MKKLVIAALLFALHPSAHADLYKVDCRDAVRVAYWTGFKFEITNGTSVSCMMNACSLYAKSGAFMDSDCSFRLFSGKRLAPNWRFIAYQGQLEGYGIDPSASYKITKAPPSGTQDVETVIQVKNRNPNKNDARYDVRYIILDGPAGSYDKWQEAFR